MYSTEPDSEILRSRLGELDENCIKGLGLKAQFLFGCRRSELCGKWAILTTDIRFDKFNDHDVVVFYLKTAKRGGKVRPIALPKTEFWVPEIVDLFKDGFGKVFPYSAKTLYREAVKVYKGLEYEIDRYMIDYETKQYIDSHSRRAATHFGRHLRAKELTMKYHFTPIQLAYYMGWSLGRSVGGSSMMDKYIALQWQDYISKLIWT